jgi:RNA polymerase sigma factor (sigma-70 family)
MSSPDRTRAGPPRQRLTPDEAGLLVLAAGRGDAQAWRALVEAFSGLIMAVTSTHRLSAGDAADVSQTVWLRLVEFIDRIEDPTKVGPWLATTARHECLRVLGQAKRQPVVPNSELLLELIADDQPAVDEGLLVRERAADVRWAVAQLPSHSQRLIGLLMMDPPPSYQEISAVTGLPIGSIGPTRGRLLHKVERLLTAQSGTSNGRLRSA